MDQRVYQERCARHGWGDTSLLKEEGYQGLNPQQQGVHSASKVRPASPRGPDGRNGLFGVLQMTEQGGKDSWIGHPQIDPTKGKRPVAAPQDSKGRRDLFDVLHARAPGGLAEGAGWGRRVVPVRVRTCACWVPGIVAAWGGVGGLVSMQVAASLCIPASSSVPWCRRRHSARC